MVTLGILHLPLQGFWGYLKLGRWWFQRFCVIYVVEESGEKQSSYDLEDTQLKINMKHNNAGLEDYFPLQMGDFSFHVEFPGCIFQIAKILILDAAFPSCY